MAKLVKLLSVFVACPTDCDPYRSTVRSAIAELNQSLEKSLAVTLRYIGWDEGVRPGIADRAQQVIHERVGDEYDILVGILAVRLGTPTGDSESGTAEEFQRAIERNRETGSPAVLVYIDKTPRDAHSLDLEQFGKLRSFIAGLQSSGVLTCDFADTAGLERSLRLHLTDEANKIVNRTPDDWRQSASRSHNSPHTSDGRDDLPGVLDAIADTEEQLTSANATLDRMILYLGDLATQAHDRAAAAESMSAASAAQAKAFVNAFADELSVFTARTRNELPLLAGQYQSAFDGATLLARVQLITGSPEARASILETADALCELAKNTAEANSHVREFRAEVQSIPSLTSRFKQAQQQTVLCLDSILVEFGRLAQSAVATAALIRSLCAS